MRSGSGARCSGIQRWRWRWWSPAARPLSRQSCRRLSSSARWGSTRSCSTGIPRVGSRGGRHGSSARYDCSGWDGGRAGRAGRGAAHAVGSTRGSATPSRRVGGTVYFVILVFFKILEAGKLSGTDHYITVLNRVLLQNRPFWSLLNFKITGKGIL